MRYYIDNDLGLDVNPGTREQPFKTLQKGITVCGIGDEILMSADAFPAQDIDLSAIVIPSIKITANRGTTCIIDRFIPGTTLLMIQNGEWHFGVRANIGVKVFNPATRSILFDNATVHLDREKNLNTAYSYVNPQVFYHCNLIINSAIRHHIFLCCDIDINDPAYWYKQQNFFYYHNHIIIPDGMSDYRVPIFDVLGFSDLIDDIYKDAFYSRGGESRTSEFIYGFDALYAPLDSMNGISFKAGPDVAAKNAEGFYQDDDWAFLLGDLITFRDRLSLGTKIGTTRQNPAMVWMNNVDKRYGDVVFPATGSTGFCYRCIISGTTDAIEPTWPIALSLTVTDGSVTWLCISPNEITSDPVAEIYDAPNFFERYIKNLYDDTFILNEKLLYYQGIMNGQYGAEGFSFNYERYGIDIKSILAFNVAETWKVAGSLLGLSSLTECDNCATAVQEFNKRKNFPIGRLPFYFDTTSHSLVFHRRVTSWWLPAFARQYWLDATPIRIGTIIYALGPLGSWLEFECTGEGTTGVLVPAFSTASYLDYVTDNTVTWRCYGPAMTPSATVTTDYRTEIEAAMETQDKSAAELGIAGLLVAADNYTYRTLYSAYDNTHRHFEYDYTMALQRQDTEQVMAIGDIVVGWNYLYLDLTDATYKNHSGTALKPLFDLYIRDTRKKEVVPMAMIRFSNPGAGLIVEQAILLRGGVVGYDSLPVAPPLTYISWPNNVFSYASASRGGFAVTEKNASRDDAILENLFRQVFAVDTELYRAAFVKEWYEYADKPVQVGQLVRASATIYEETCTFMCTSAGYTGAAYPMAAFAATLPGASFTETPPAPAVGATWTNLGYIAFDWRQIENP